MGVWEGPLLSLWVCCATVPDSQGRWGGEGLLLCALPGLMAFFLSPGVALAPSWVGGYSLLCISMKGCRPCLARPRALTSLVMLVDALSMDLRAERRSRLRVDGPLV